METNEGRHRKPNDTPPTSEILRRRPIMDEKDRMADIVLFGKSSQGKSSTLQHLAVLLLSGGKTLNPNIVKEFEKAFWRNNRYIDFMILIPYQREDDGKHAMIYLATDGDNWLIVENNMEFFYQYLSRKGKRIYVYDGTKFTLLLKLPEADKVSWLKERPTICVSPANFNNGAIQAQRYYLDATYNDWKCEHWIRREREDKLTGPLPEYSHKIICDTHDITARNLIGLIHSVMDEDYK